LRGVTLPPFSPRLAVGVGHIVTHRFSVTDLFVSKFNGDALLVHRRVMWSDAVGVGTLCVGLAVSNNPDAVPPVRRSNGGSWYAVPFRIIPERGQRPENAVKSPSKQR
jgi:hypothetical protein